MGKSKEQDPKDDLLTRTLESIQAKLGTSVIAQWGNTPIREYDTISTGSMMLDNAVGNGGLPRGRITEIYGPESSGKTTLTLHVVANAQRAGGICAFIDAEHALDIGYAAALGVDIPSLLVSQPDCGEDALEVASMLAQSGAVSCIVVDSVAALTPRAELEGDMGDTHVGLQARMMSQAMRKLNGALHRTNTMCIFINQIRHKIGVTFGSPETTPGGNALKFYASIRLDIRRIGSNKDKEVVVSNKTRVKVKKNKCAPPFQEAEFDIRFGVGIDRLSELVTLGVETKVVTKAGSHFSYGKDDDKVKMGQGLPNSVVFLEENPDIADEIEAKIRVALKGAGLRAPKPSDFSRGKSKDKPKGKQKAKQSTSAADAAALLTTGKSPKSA